MIIKYNYHCYLSFKWLSINLIKRHLWFYSTELYHFCNVVSYVTFLPNMIWLSTIGDSSLISQLASYILYKQKIWHRNKLNGWWFFKRIAKFNLSCFYQLLSIFASCSYISGYPYFKPCAHIWWLSKSNLKVNCHVNHRQTTYNRPWYWIS